MLYADDTYYSIKVETILICICTFSAFFLENVICNKDS